MNFPDIFKEFYKQHDLVSYRTTWHEQRVVEKVLDLQGFISSISGQLEEERIDYSKANYPLGFFEIEQPSRIRYIKIIFMFTLLERRARSLCKLIFELKKTNKTIDDYKGSFLERVKCFIKEYLDIDFGNLSDWNDIIAFQKIRDCIIHCGGKIDESRDAEYIKSLCLKGENFEISDNGYLLINIEYVGKIESYTIGFICNVIDELTFAIKGIKKYPEDEP